MYELLIFREPGLSLRSSSLLQGPSSTGRVNADRGFGTRNKDWSPVVRGLFDDFVRGRFGRLGAGVSTAHVLAQSQACRCIAGTGPPCARLGPSRYGRRPPEACFPVARCTDPSTSSDRDDDVVFRADELVRLRREACPFVHERGEDLVDDRLWSAFVGQALKSSIVSHTMSSAISSTSPGTSRRLQAVVKALHGLNWRAHLPDPFLCSQGG